jgi:hypothetical protein
MGTSRAVEIFADINSVAIPDREKAAAIHIVLSKPYCTGKIKKDEMMAVVAWLWSRCFRVRKKKPEE